MKLYIKDKTELSRIKRHLRIRKKVIGTKERPRLSVHRSHKNIYLQFINDIDANTIFSISTLSKVFREKFAKGGNIEASKQLGILAGNEANKKGIENIVFDRGGYLYHGRIKAIAEGLREAGLKF